MSTQKWSRIVLFACAGLLAFPIGCVTSGYHNKKMKEMTAIQYRLHQIIDRNKQTLSRLRTRCKERLSLLKNKNSKQAIKLKRALTYIDTIDGNKKWDTMRGKLTKVFATRIKARQLDLRVENGYLKLSLPDKVLFAFNSSSVSTNGRKIIREVAQELLKYGYRWQIAGHTDSVGDAMYNRRLSAKRALSVLRIMVREGMPPKQLTAAAYGEIAPVRANDDSGKRAINRRVELILQPRFKSIVTQAKHGQTLSQLCTLPKNKQS